MRQPSKSTTDNMIAGNLLVAITDHLPNFVIIPNSKSYNDKVRPNIKILSEKNIEKFNVELKKIRWNEILGNTNDPDFMCNSFYQF